MPGSTARCRTPSGDPRVVAGANRVETEGQRAVEHRGELDLLVAAQARVRGAARGVLGDEILHHVAVEALGHVPHVERDPDDVGGAARVPRVLQRAAAPGAGPVRRRVRRQRQMDAGHLVTRVYRTSRGRRGVHPARHRREHPKTTLPDYARGDDPTGPPAAALRFSPKYRAGGRAAGGQRAGRGQRAAARRARSTTSRITRPRASTSCWVEVWPSEKRSEPRARDSSAPMASST